VHQARPDSETRVKIASDGKSLDEAGVKFILNPYDEFAVEEALRRKERPGRVKSSSSRSPRRGSGDDPYGPRHGGRSRHPAPVGPDPLDGLEVAQALAAELKGAGFDLILFGKMAIDDYNHQVGPMVPSCWTCRA